MKYSFVSALFLSTSLFILSSSCVAQNGAAGSNNINAVINVAEVERIEKVLAGDEMRGRKTFSPEIDKAADFIAVEFKKAGLQTMPGSNGFRQEFAMVRTKFVSASAVFDRVAVEQKNIIAVTCQPQLKIDERSGYEMAFIKTGTNLQTEARKLIRSNKNLLVLVENSFANSFGNLSRLKSSMFKTVTNVVFVLADAAPDTWTVEAVHEITEQKMANVVGVLPGKSKKEEYVVFSGHYDHLGVGKPVNGDSIYNGANA